MPHSYGSNFAGLVDLGGTRLLNISADPTRTTAVIKNRMSDSLAINQKILCKSRIIFSFLHI